MDDLEKPFLIYALPRSRSTVIHQASKKPVIVFEPFNPKVLKDQNLVEILSEPITVSGKLDEKVYLSKESWDNIKKRLNRKDISVKILCNQLEGFSRGQVWYDHVQRERRFKIFVIQRDLREVCYSCLIAPFIGWHKVPEIEEQHIEEKIDIHVDEYDEVMTSCLDAFLNFFPRYGTVITWENLPKKFFDKEKIINEEQFSSKRLNIVNNLDSCLERIERIVKIYEPRINDKLSNLKE